MQKKLDQKLFSWQQYIDTMKVSPELLLLFLLTSCIYDPPLKGKTIFIHNQTGKTLFVVDSLTGNYFKLYDTAKVNDRRYISRRPNFMTKYGLWERFYSNNEIDSIRRKRNNRLTFYFIEQEFLQNTPSTVLANRSFRSFEINIDTLKKYELNHVFITENTVLLEHKHDFYTRWKQ